MNELKALTLAAIILGIVLFARADTQNVLARRVSGTVYNAQERPLSSAVVYLHNLRTHRIRTYISKRKGFYHFSGLKPYDDYEIHAEHDNMTSDKKTISKADVKNEFVIDLKVDKRK